MKRILCAALVVAAFLVPATPQELGRLKPVEVLKVEALGDLIRIETDAADTGQGETMEQALADLHAGASGTIYLDTARYLIVPAGREDLIYQLAPYLKCSVKVCCWEGKMPMDQLGPFLDCHRPEFSLKTYQPGEKLQTLLAEKEHLRLM